MKMIDIQKKQCTGCAACADVCSKNCIDMSLDSEGFRYPKVNSLTCVNCDLCKSVCPALNGAECDTLAETYAVKSNDEKVRFESSSGGAFSQIAKYILNNGGIVFGAAFDDDWTVHHIAVDSEGDLRLLRTSKYTQSRMHGIYRQVKKKLKEGYKVLFTGTPCQVNALKLFLKEDYDDLILVDFICHGVPSEVAWKKYVEYISRGRLIEKINFRDKSVGWNDFSLSFVFKNFDIYAKTLREDPFLRLFLSDYILRPACYNCPSKTPNRSSDITLADLWGAREIKDNIDDDKGLSMVILNTDKGKRVFESVSDSVTAEKIDYLKAIAHNPSAVHSVGIPKNRDKVLNDIFRIDNPDFAHIARKYDYSNKFTNKIKRKLKYALKTLLK